MNLEVGSTVGDYQIVDVLGAGGMGKVFKVQSTISHRLEAMKILLPDLSGEPELADRFLREIQVLARLEHPNIAGLRTALRFENQLLMVMELVDGVSLDQRLKQGPLPVRDAVRCIDQILAALAYAHKSGVIHRDIKPANMMLMPDGTVKLMDFGIAKGANDRRLTMTGGTMGSVYYMSPEQIRGTEAVDARSDLYSVGVSLYELVTGKHAFDGDSQFAIMGAHLEKNPIPPITIDPKLPPQLNDLILLSVTREPELRFQTAEAFRNALKSVSEETLLLDTPHVRPVTRVANVPPSPAAPVPAAVAGAPPQKSNRALWATLGALCFVIVLVGAIQFGPWKKASADSPPDKGALPQTRTVLKEVPTQSTPTVEVPPAQAQSTPNPSLAEQPGASKPSAKMPSVAMQRAQQTPQAPMQQQSQPPIPQQQQQQPPIQQQQVQAPADPQPDLAAQRAQQAHRAELQKVRESMVLVSARVNSIHSALQSVQRSQAASGLGMRSDWQQAAGLMDSFLQGSNDALSAGDTAAAKDFLEKSERQLEKLEKALNK